MTVHLAFLRQLALGLAIREATYNAPAGLGDLVAQRMHGYDESVYEVWNDGLQDDTDVVSGSEVATLQTVPRTSVRVVYQTPRVTPQTLAGLLALTLGAVETTQEGILQAYRHRLTPYALGTSLPSVPMVARHEAGGILRYGGITGQRLTLANSGPFLTLTTTLLGAGSRVTSALTPLPKADAPWLLWGDAHVYVKDTGGVPLTIPTPTQAGTHLGAGTIDLSLRVRDWALTWDNVVDEPGGYRASTGRERGQMLPQRRTGSVTLRWDIESTREAIELGEYLTQARLAMEMQLMSQDIIAPGGTLRYGVTLLFPALQWQAPLRSQTNQIEGVTMVATLIEDGVNPGIIGDVYDDQPGYLVPTMAPLATLQWIEPWEHTWRVTGPPLWTEDWESSWRAALTTLVWTESWEA